MLAKTLKIIADKAMNIAMYATSKPSAIQRIILGLAPGFPSEVMLLMCWAISYA